VICYLSDGLLNAVIRRAKSPSEQGIEAQRHREISNVAEHMFDHVLSSRNKVYSG